MYKNLQECYSSHTTKSKLNDYICMMNCILYQEIKPTVIYYTPYTKITINSQNTKHTNGNSLQNIPEEMGCITYASHASDHTHFQYINIPSTYHSQDKTEKKFYPRSCLYISRILS
ncbi:hypothetical protein R5R35_011712 [Gryllus longicercus]|uniref:Uncharacterized protein n=1 Tax=Gryllus longicercus TaxID=2509291 RepID=A0AAN9V8J3_9ORTH